MHYFCPHFNVKYSKWLTETDATGSVTRVVLLDYKKGFDLIDHKLLIAKLLSYGVRLTVINWIIDFDEIDYSESKYQPRVFPISYMYQLECHKELELALGFF